MRPRLFIDEYESRLQPWMKHIPQVGYPSIAPLLFLGHPPLGGRLSFRCRLSILLLLAGRGFFLCGSPALLGRTSESQNHPTCQTTLFQRLCVCVCVCVYCCRLGREGLGCYLWEGLWVTRALTPLPRMSIFLSL